MCPTSFARRQWSIRIDWTSLAVNKVPTWSLNSLGTLFTPDAIVRAESGAVVCTLGKEFDDGLSIKIDDDNLPRKK